LSDFFRIEVLKFFLIDIELANHIVKKKAWYWIIIWSIYFKQFKEFSRNFLLNTSLRNMFTFSIFLRFLVKAPVSKNKSYFFSKLTAKNILICQKHHLKAFSKSDVITIKHNKKSINLFYLFNYHYYFCTYLVVSIHRIIQSGRINYEKLINRIFPINFSKSNFFGAWICPIRNFKLVSILRLRKCIACWRFTNSCSPKNKNIWQIYIIIIVMINFI
jgi:hypothetical protein